MAKKKAPVKKAAVKATTEKAKVHGEKDPVTGCGIDTIGHLAKTCILGGSTLEATVVAVQKKFPDTNFGKNSYYWYRNKLIKAGQLEKRVGGPKPKKVAAKATPKKAVPRKKG
ncbi:MAG TPA: hypothetical protein VMV86_03110 [Methanosarcinales archaeon]|nr:hypothetical protein [Methanosarcinales archaeon]